MSYFNNRLVKNAFADISSVVIYDLSKGRRDYMNMVKQGGYYAGSKWLYDMIKPTVEGAVRGIANSLFGRLADLVVEIVTSAAIYYALNKYVLHNQVNLVDAIWFFSITSPMSDRLEQVLG